MGSYIEKFYDALCRHSTIGYVCLVEFEKWAGRAQPRAHETGSGPRWACPIKQGPLSVPCYQRCLMPIAGLGCVGLIVGAIMRVCMRPSILGVLLSPHRMDAQFRAKRWHYIGPVGVAGALAFAAARDFRSRRRAWALAAMASGLVMMAYGAPGAAAQDGSQWRADVGSGQAKFGWAHPDAYLGDDEFSGPFLLCDEPGKTVSLIVPVEGLPGGKTLALHLVRGSETVKLVAEVGPNEESVEAKIGPSHPVYGLFHGTGTLTAQVSGKPKETYSLEQFHLNRSRIRRP